MRRMLLAALLLALLTAQGGTPRPTRSDAFLASREVRPLVETATLPTPLRDRIERGRISSHEPRLGLPTFFWAAPAEVSPRALGLDAEQAARRHLGEHAELYRASPAALLESTQARIHDTGDGAVIATLRRSVAGVPVFRDEAKVVMGRDLSLVAISGYLTPGTKPLGGFDLPEQAALASAFRHLAGRPLQAGELGTARASQDGYRRYPIAGQKRPARAREVYFPLPNGLEPAYYTELELARAGGGTDYFSYVVSARGGEVLFRKNLTAADSFSYRVWADSAGDHVPDNGPIGHAPLPYPYATPSADWAPPFVAPVLVTLQSGPIATGDPWLPAGATQTMGNNVNAYADISEPDFYDEFDVVADVTSPGVFDRAYDPTLPPDASLDQRKAAVAQLFYDVNFFHDWYYDKGFDEVSGNAQLSNYGRGGAAFDPLEAQAQDFSGSDNADMSTPSDGESPRMQMYVFGGRASGTVTVDDAPTATWKASVGTFAVTTFAVTATAQLVDDGTSPATDGCEDFAVSPGAIAVVDRGLCTFVSKAQRAEAAGAAAVVIVNNVAGGRPPLSTWGEPVGIPVLGLSLADGTALKQRMAAGPVQLTLQGAQTTARDGTLDNTVVAHEWGHYISNRLIGDANGLSNNQGLGLGEGWGDFHALLMAVREGDGAGDWSGVFPMATYVSAASRGASAYYFGMRRVPYSTDFSKNALTFKHIQEGVALPEGVPTSFGQSGNGNSEVHATGEVWATMLWECYAALLRDGSRLTFAQAQDRMRGYLVASYKATPLMPTFVEARDALLAVAAAKDPADLKLFAEAFARRGLGLRAVAPDRDSQDNLGAVESFVTGNDVELVSARLDDSLLTCDQDGSLDNDESGRLTLTLKNVGVGTLSATRATIASAHDGLTFPGGNVASFEAIPPFGTATASVEVSLMDVRGIAGLGFTIVVSDPQLAPPSPKTLTRSFRVNFDTAPAGASADDVEAAKSLWYAGCDPDGNTSSNFRVFADSATSHWWYGPDPASPADTWLISPQLKVASAGSFGISFSHRYAFEDDVDDPTIHYDAGVLELTDNAGKTWVDVGGLLFGGYPGRVVSPSTNPLAGRPAFVGKSPDYPQFKTVYADLGSKYAGKIVQLRFRIGSDDAAADKGWEVDDVAFTGLAQLPFAAIVDDPNLCYNAPPVAKAAAEVVADERTVVKLAGAATDAEGDAVTLDWKQVSGPQVALDRDEFTAPEVVQDTRLEFALRAFDGRHWSKPVTQRVTVRNVNRPPVAFAPGVVQAKAGEVVKVHAFASDPEGDPVTFAWRRTGGAILSLAAADTDTVELVAPNVAFDITLTLQVTASDGALESTPRVVEVKVKGLAGADAGTGPEQDGGGCGCSSGPGTGGATVLLAALVALPALRRRRS